MDAVSEVDSAAVEREIRGEGTPERMWRSWPQLHALERTSLEALAPPPSRIVVVSPHPDDEILGCGGALASWAQAGRDVLVVGVTDGEASYPGSLRWTPRTLANKRREERASGLTRLGLAGQACALAMPDGGLATHERLLVQTLEALIRPGDVLFTTWRHDGHPDHEAAARATAAAARTNGCRWREMPVWMWHWSRPEDVRVPWRLLRRLPILPEALAMKRDAIAAHASQLQPVHQEGLAPVLPDWALARLLRPAEFFFLSEDET